MPKNNSILNRYRLELDGLRAFSIVSVIINHLNKEILQGGFLGVDIFFVISGYVITSSLTSRNINDFKEFIIGFYNRRFKRLAPALIFFVLLTSFLTLLFISKPTVFLRTGITSLFGFSNLYLIRISNDYFAQESLLNPFKHTWSLAVEAQFYLIFPFIIWMTGYGRKKHNGSRNMLFVCIFLFCISLIFFIFTYTFNQSVGYYLMPARLWEIISGCIVYILINDKKNSNFSNIKIFPEFIILAMIGIMFLPSYLAIITTPSIVFFTLLLIISIKENTLIFRLFTNKKIAYLGHISYSLYLWHWGIISISRWTTGIHFWSIPFQLTIILLISIFSYEFIEKKIRSNIYLIKQNISILIGIIMTISSAILILLLGSNFKGILFLGDKNRIDNYSESVLWNRFLCNNNKKQLNSINDNLFKKCWFNIKDKLKDGIKTKRVYFYGNSYNEQLMPIPASLISRRKDLEFNSFFTNRCQVSINLSKDGDSPGCARIFKNYLEYFHKTSKVGDILIIAGNNFNNYKSEDRFYKNKNLINSDEILTIIFNEFKTLSEKLSIQNKTLVVTSQIPVLKKDPAICGHWFSKTNKNCNSNLIFDNYQNQRSIKIIELFRKLEQHGVIFLDIYTPLENIFEENKSNIYSFFFDKEHLSKNGALELVEDFENIFNKN